MSQADLQAGDILVFQIEAAYVLLRVLAIEETENDRIWHISAFEDMFPDLDSAEKAAASPERLTVSHEHLALTDHAFESTQVARIGRSTVDGSDKERVDKWRASEEPKVFDRSVRLVLGLR